MYLHIQSIETINVWMGDSKVIKCPFCGVNETKLENTILDETQYFFVRPAVGSIVEGYILIISKRHINSMSELTVEEMEDYENLINKYREVFKSIYSKYPIIFEHGTPNTESQIRANSVMHAHTHIVNHNYKNENYLIKELNFKRIDKISDMSRDKNYILYINPNNCIYITSVFKPINQIMRLKIVEDLNMPDKYDWRKNRFENNISVTIDKISSYLKSGK